MNRDVVQFLDKRARALLQHFIPHMHNRHGKVGAQDWAGYTGPLLFEIDGNDITFRRKDDLKDAAYIKFLGVSPVDITKEVLHDPKTTGKTVVDASTHVIKNRTSTEQTRIYRVDIGEESTTAEDIGVDVATGISAQFSAGGDLAFSQFVFTASLSVTNSWNKHTEQKNTKNVITETEVVVPPNSQITVTTTREVGKFEQEAEYWGGLDYAIEVFSHNDYYARWDTVGELKQMLCGLGPVNRGAWSHPSEDQFYTGRFYRDFGGITEADMKKFFPGDGIYYKKTIKFDKATTGNVELKESKL